MAQYKHVPKVGILLFNGVELLDYAGPAEVFAVAGYQVYTIAQHKTGIRSMDRYSLQADTTISEVPPLDILVVPGGETHPLIQDKAFLTQLGALCVKTDYLLSVCTGALLLAALGLLDGKKATTFHDSLNELARLAPKASILPEARYTDNGKILSTAGVTAGIDGALHLVLKLSGSEKAEKVARYLAYPPEKPGKWKPYTLVRQ